MSGVDELIARHAGHGLGVVLGVAFLLGLRHATDPDHLVAVSTLTATVREGKARMAARLGGAWGAGHAVTLIAFGIPVVLFHAWIPSIVERLAEMTIGAIIVLLAARVLVAWRRGAFHAHAHEHGGERHVHVHGHAHEEHHRHEHPARTLGQAFSIGTVHGFAGSGAVTVLLLAAVPGRTEAALALVVLAIGAAVAMTVLSSGVGSLLGTATARRSFAAAVPALGVAAAAFGAWYAVAAVASGA